MIGMVLIVAGLEVMARTWLWGFSEPVSGWVGALHLARCLVDVRPVVGFWARRTVRD